MGHRTEQRGAHHADVLIGDQRQSALSFADA
jgi:hypothetical protein